MTVIAFKGGTIPGEANDWIVEELESLLEKAKSGELRALAYATFSAGDFTGTGWVGSEGTRHPLSSAIMMLNSRYGEALREG